MCGDVGRITLGEVVDSDRGNITIFRELSIQNSLGYTPDRENTNRPTTRSTWATKHERPHRPGKRRILCEVAQGPLARVIIPFVHNFSGVHTAELVRKLQISALV